MQVEFGRTSTPDRSGFASSQRLINGYAEPQGQTAKSPIPVYATPGTTRFDTAVTGFTGACRGMLHVYGVGLYVICGTKAAKFNDDGTGTLCTGVDIAGSDLVIMAVNQNGTPQIGIVCADGYYVIDTGTNAVSKPSVANLPTPNALAFMDGYFVFSIADGRFFHSAINDALTVNALAFATAQSRSDGLRRVVNHRGALLLLGETSLEIWENAGTTPFAFARVRANIDIGCAAPQSVAQIAEATMWVDHQGIVRQMTASEPERISNHALEREINKLGKTDREALYAVVTHHDGHDFYALTSPYWTWEYDRATQLWHERRTGSDANWFARGWAHFNGKSIFGQTALAILHKVDRAATTENGTAYTFIAQSAPVHAFPNGAIFDALAVDIIPGVGITGGIDDAADPKIMLDWSDDGGATWKGGRVGKLGPAGDRKRTVTFYQLGSCGRAGRTFRLAASSSVMRGILNADARVRPVRQG